MADPTLSTLSGFIEDVLEQSRWRAGKAAEYPEDERNQNAADHLHAMHEWLLALSTESPLLDELDAVLERLYRDPDFTMDFQPGITDRLGRFGFSNKVEETPAVFEAELRGLIRNIEEYLAPPPSITFEGQVQRAAVNYVETLKELEEEYLEQKRQEFYEAAEGELTAVPEPDQDDDAEEEVAARWRDELADERDAFAEMVREAESDAWRAA